MLAIGVLNGWWYLCLSSRLLLFRGSSADGDPLILVAIRSSSREGLASAVVAIDSESDCLRDTSVRLLGGDVVLLLLLLPELP